MKERRENLDILKPEIIDMVVKKMKHNTYLSLEFFTLAMRISSFRHDVVMVMILGVDGNYFMAITDMPRGNDLYVKTKYDRKLRPSPRPRHIILAKTIPGFQHDLANYSTMIMILGNAGNYLMAKALFTEIQELGLCIDMVAANNIIRCYTSVIQDALDLQIGKLCGTIGIAVAGKHGSFVVFFDSLVTKIASDQIGQLYLEEKDREYQKVTVIRDEPQLQIGIAGSVSDARCIIMVLKIEMSSQAQHGVTMTCEAAANFVFQRCVADEHCTRSSFFIFDNKKLFAVKRDNTRQYQLLQLDAVEQPFLTIGSGGPHAEGQAHGKKATLGQITNLGLDALAEACDNDPHCGGDKYYAYSNVKSHFDELLLKFAKKNFSYQYARRKRPRASSTWPSSDT
ncbi:hypothetical protein SELMODRAFT_404515 [Selaginella moellendorffii]|uniref:Uncharacterized protein n=1 Tax=Selaginella moellendorffii TaxID=88036 RepID=D8QVK7_SELML|nr:hypothetical protein SELMODRAFT_404515 [Selaginella moellendorffii]